MSALQSTKSRSGVAAQPGGNSRFAKAQKEALQKATDRGTWAEVVFYPGDGVWTVPSWENPTFRYTIDRGNPHAPDASWWIRLRCECPADEHGLSICYHKAAVYLRLLRQRREQDTYAQEYVPPRRVAAGTSWPGVGSSNVADEGGQGLVGQDVEDVGYTPDLPEPVDDLGDAPPKGDPD